MTWNEKLLNTKVVQLIKIYIYYIVYFYIWESVSKQESQSFEYHIDFMELYVRPMDLEIHFRNTLSNAKMTYVLNVDLDEWTNLGIHDFSRWDYLGFQKLVSRCQNFKIQNLNGSNFAKWKVDNYKKFRPWWVLFCKY